MNNTNNKNRTNNDDINSKARNEQEANRIISVCGIACGSTEEALVGAAIETAGGASGTFAARESLC